jgi:hypothetical protein
LVWFLIGDVQWRFWFGLEASKEMDLVWFGNVQLSRFWLIFFYLVWIGDVQG